jgi:hypothetical protein
MAAISGVRINSAIRTIASTLPVVGEKIIH